MRVLARSFDTGARALSYLLGGFAIVLAAAAVMTSSSAADIAHWAESVLGWSFVVLLAALVLMSIYSWVRMTSGMRADDGELWLNAGVQAANGITTLALTYTLLGISLGIGSLAGQELTPETVQTVIRSMTANFSLAFMTTVIGLPVSAILRSLLVVTHARNRDRRPRTAFPA